ncbi:MAG: DUF2288 domain-containing protein [Marinicella sp.]|nr:DUF2288 family protein [Xanthomonadales bacterium]
MTEQHPSTKERFTREMAPIAFKELQKHFAKGIMIHVSQDLDLVEVAVKLHEDDTQAIKNWMAAEKLVRAHDEHAKNWLAQDMNLMAVTAAPWVLVQEIVETGE